MKTINPETQKIWHTLTKVAEKTLERKRRLGEYAVIYRQGKPVILQSDYDEEFIKQVFDDANKMP